VSQKVNPHYYLCDITGTKIP